jgi:hypothetical protein
MMMSNGLPLPVREGTWLVYKRTLPTSQRPGAITKDIQTYFEALGYTQTHTTPTLIFERGHWLKGLYSPNPASQKMRVLVDVLSSSEHETLIEVRLRVNTWGSFSFNTDHEFRLSELEGLHLMVAYGYLDIERSRYAADRAKWFSISVALAGIAILSGVIAGLVLLLTGVIL